MKFYLCLLLAVTLTLSEVLAEDGKPQVSQPQNSQSQDSQPQDSQPQDSQPQNTTSQPGEDQPEDVDEDDGEHLRGPQCTDLMTDITNHCIKKNHEECFVCLFKGCGPEDGLAIPLNCDNMNACIAKNFDRC